MAVNVAGLRRNLKNIAHNYTDAQVKVREATSNDPWGPSSTLMSEIADMTYNVVAFSEIMQMIWKRLNDHGKNWRHVYKALVLLEYLIKTGSDKVAQQCKENIYAIQTLKDFQYFEECKDYGMSVREKSKSMVSLLNDDERLQSERAKALKAKERFHQAMGHGSDSEAQREVDPDPKPPGWGTRPLSTDLESARPSTIGEEELQLQLALAMSKEEAEREEERRKSDELRLQLALNKSKDDSAVSPGGAEANRSSSLDDILDLRLDGLTSAGATAAVARSGSAAGAFSDPWAAREDQQFGAAAAAPVPAADPWGMPKKQAPVAPPTLADPWAPPPVAGAVGGGLGLDLGDPWAPPTAPAAPTASDPWGATKSSDPNPDPFDMLGMRSTIQGSPSPSFGQNGKLNGEASDSSSGSGGPKKKKPEDFLGENSALVNLDNLVSKPAPAASTGFGDGGLNNPFALGPFTAAATANPTPQQQNPFQSVAAPRPTLNEMRMNQGAGDGTWGRVYPDLANPFV